MLLGAIPWGVCGLETPRMRGVASAMSLHVIYLLKAERLPPSLVSQHPPPPW